MPKGGLASGITPTIENSNQYALASRGTTEYDTVPSMLHFIKSVQRGDADMANAALNHVAQARGSQTATDLMFLAKRMKDGSINDIAKRSIAGETNPQMKQLYHLINENPDILSKMEFAQTVKPVAGLANSLAGN